MNAKTNTTTKIALMRTVINEKLYTVQSIAVSEQLANTDGRIVNEAPRQMLSGGGD